MFFCTKRISPEAENDMRRKMTSIVIMSTIGTTFSSAFTDFRPCCILPPMTFESWNRLAGRRPGMTMGMAIPPP